MAFEDQRPDGHLVHVVFDTQTALRSTAADRSGRRQVLERGHRTLTVLREGGKVVTIPLAPRTARAVDLAVGERLWGPIFTRADGTRLDRHGAARIVRRIAKRAGVDKRIGPHTLRHAFITAALDAGVPLRDAQEAASHADSRTTMRYDRARVSLDRPRDLHRLNLHRRGQPINRSVLAAVRHRYGAHAQSAERIWRRLLGRSRPPLRLDEPQLWRARGRS